MNEGPEVDINHEVDICRKIIHSCLIKIPVDRESIKNEFYGKNYPREVCFSTKSALLAKCQILTIFVSRPRNSATVRATEF